MGGFYCIAMPSNPQYKIISAREETGICSPRTVYTNVQYSTYLHVVEDEEKRFNGEPLKELKRIKVSGRMLVVVVGRRVWTSHQIRSARERERERDHQDEIQESTQRLDTLQYDHDNNTNSIITEVVSM